MYPYKIPLTDRSLTVVVQYLKKVHVFRNMEGQAYNQGPSNDFGTSPLYIEVVPAARSGLPLISVTAETWSGSNIPELHGGSARVEVSIVSIARVYCS